MRTKAFSIGPELPKLGRTETDVAQNAAERPDF